MLDPMHSLGQHGFGESWSLAGRLLITLQYKRTRWYDITLTVPLSIEGHYLPMIPIWFTHQQRDPLIASFINLLATANMVTNIRAGNLTRAVCFHRPDHLFLTFHTED